MEIHYTEILAIVWRYLLTISISDYFDIGIMAFVLYKMLTIVRTTKASSLLKGLIFFAGIMLLSSVFKLRGIYYLMSRLVNWGVLALVVLFQPEIRHLLEQMGSRRIMAFFSPKSDYDSAYDKMISQTVIACTEMAESRTGALIVFEREMRLDDYTRSGTILDAAVSAELYKNIFFVKAPMHDGAVIIRNCRVFGAGCMLPLSRNEHLSKDLGMRHRAGIGMSEACDAVVVIVSEETGGISVAVGGILKRHLKAETLENLLRTELINEQEEEENQKSSGFLSLFRRPKNGGED